MKTTDNISQSSLENVFKIDDSGNGFSGFILPGSGYTIGNIQQENECTVYVTNTGITLLKFYLSDIKSNNTEIDCMVLQPGQLVTLSVNKNSILSSNILHVTNLHSEKEGSFVILIIDNKEKKKQISHAMA
jgi:hypothetical protein